MKKLLIHSLAVISIFIASGLADILPSVSVSAAHAKENKTEKKRRRTPAMNSRVYSQLARAQQLADEGKVEEGLEVLDDVKAKASSLNSYERAMMFNFYGFIYYNVERIEDALNAFEKVVEQSPIPESLEKSTLFSLSQLAMANEQYDKTLQYLARWENVEQETIPAKIHVLKAQASYQLKNYEAAELYIVNAIKQQEQDGFEPEENWYVLQRAIYFELKQSRKVTEVLEIMVRKFNKPEYWVQLGGMYGEIGEEKKQLAVLEASFQQGFVTKKSDFRNLSQIYYLQGLPYKSAMVMEKGFELNILKKNEKNLTFLAQSYVGAKEYELAIQAYTQLSQLTKNGEADQQIAELRLQQGKYQQTIDAAKIAAEKGKLGNPGNLYLALGMASFNLKQFDQAMDAFNKAIEIKSSKRMATQWLKFVEREKKSAEQLALNS